MNSLYLILIAICFSAGVITGVLKSNDPQSANFFSKEKIENSKNEQAIIDSGYEEEKPITIFTE